MIGRIYLIRNTVNGKGYVGQTMFSLTKRFDRHKTVARCGSSYALHRAMREHGADNFSIVEVAACEGKTLLNQLERLYISHLGTRTSTASGYNMTEGGEDAPGTQDWRHSDASRAKISAVHLGRRKSQEHRTKISHAMRGRQVIHTPEHMVNISASNKGRPWSEARRAAQNARSQGDLL